jgi:hypothetical protein
MTQFHVDLMLKLVFPHNKINLKASSLSRAVEVALNTAYTPDGVILTKKQKPVSKQV